MQNPFKQIKKRKKIRKKADLPTLSFVFGHVTGNKHIFCLGLKNVIYSTLEIECWPCTVVNVVGTEDPDTT